jgi:hypothetical protein
MRKQTTSKKLKMKSYKNILTRRYREELLTIQGMIERELESLQEGNYKASRSLPSMLASAADSGKAILTLENAELADEKRQ